MAEHDSELARLDDYVTGIMPEEAADVFEQELFSAAAESRASEAEFVDHFSLLGAYLAARGGLDGGTTRERIDQLRAAGLRVQFTTPQPSLDAKLPPVDPDADLYVTRLDLDVRGYDHIEIQVYKADGTHVKTFLDVRGDPEDGRIYVVCEAPLARLALKIGPIVTHISGIRDGRRQELARFQSTEEG
jgi:hypothetical protein